MFRSKFFNIQFAQNEFTIPTFDEFFAVTSFDRIIEIGSGCGIFSMFLGLFCFYNDKQFITYDIKNALNEKTKKLLDVLKIDQRIKDVFESVSEIENEIKKPGSCVVLCDGGNKAREFEEFSKFLKVDDFILAHDYSKSLEFFKSDMKDKYWNWFEIDDKKIQETCLKYSLESFMGEEFQKCAWVCKKKIK